MDLDDLLENQLGHLQKFQKLHIKSISTSGVGIELHEQQFTRYVAIFKIAIFGDETCPLAKVPEVAHIHSLYPKGSKLSLFSLYGQRFLRYRPIFKMPYLGIKLSMAIGQNARSCTYTLFLPHRVEIELIFTLWAALSEIRADFQNCHIWA